MLATTRHIAMKKIETLLRYCSENYIKLQTAKCSFMCVNSNNDGDEKPFKIQNLNLDVTMKEPYLGSVITNSIKIADDVRADITYRQCSIVKFFSFLRCNQNAPMFVKKKALEACTITSLLYNAETWADARFEYLEVTYRRMLKSILGVGMTTCNEFVYIELGMLSIKTRVMMMQYKFWKNITEISDDNPLTYVINEAKKYKLKEIRHYEKLVQSFASVEEIISKFYENLRNSI